MFFRLLIVSLALASCAHSQGPDSALTSRVAAWRAEADVQGVAVSIYEAGKVQSASDGVREASGAAIEYDDSFSIASVSKSFTAAAILKLADQGVFNLGDSAAALSGLEIPGDITVAALLRHEAGMPEYMGGALSFEKFLGEHANGREAWSSEEIRAFAVSADWRSDPGFSYSNANYVVLGAIIEKQTNLPLASALKSLAFDPAGLASARLIRTSADDPNAFGFSGNMAGALGSAQLDRRLTRELATAGDAAGGVAINAPDLARWAATYFSGTFVSGVTFEVPDGGKAFGLAGDRISVGPGVYEVVYNGRVVRLHGGDGLGVSALAVYEPATERSVAIIINDDKVRSLGFGDPGFLDAFAMALLAD